LLLLIIRIIKLFLKIGPLSIVLRLFNCNAF
jgi:hypothetical protein